MRLNFTGSILHFLLASESSFLSFSTGEITLTDGNEVTIPGNDIVERLTRPKPGEKPAKGCRWPEKWHPAHDLHQTITAVYVSFRGT
jgi:hypothetical protein